MCILRDNIPADVWAEIEAIANSPRYAPSQPAASVVSQSTNNQTNSLWAWNNPTTSMEDKNATEGR